MRSALTSDIRPTHAQIVAKNKHISKRLNLFFCFCFLMYYCFCKTSIKYVSGYILELYNFNTYKYTDKYNSSKIIQIRRYNIELLNRLNSPKIAHIFIDLEQGLELKPKQPDTIFLNS